MAKYMPCARRLICASLFWALAGFCGADGMQAQDVVIRGAVLSADTGEPLAGVNIFLDQTTYGSSTADNGLFEITSVPPGEYRVVASMIGYATQIRHVEAVHDNPAYDVDFRLARTVLELEAIEVEADRPRAWERNLRLFEHNFIGRSENAERTEILNPYVLEFEAVDGTFRASSPAPLQIENRALGYRLSIELIQYWGSADLLQMRGPIRFEELVPSNPQEAEQWKERRRAAYEGSLMHFLRSLVDGTLRDEGFFAAHELHLGYNIERVEVGAFPILEATDRSYLYRLFFEHQLVVTYGRRRSWIRLTGDDALVHRAGYVYGTQLGEPPLAVSGDMAVNRLADLLPRDYGL